MQCATKGRGDVRGGSGGEGCGGLGTDLEAGNIHDSGTMVQLRVLRIAKT